MLFLLQRLKQMFGDAWKEKLIIVIDMDLTKTKKLNQFNKKTKNISGKKIERAWNLFQNP